MTADIKTAVVPIPLEGGTTGYIMAGATRDLPHNYNLVRCAEEVPVDADRVAYDVATKDFTPFNTDRLVEVIPHVLYDLMLGRKLYVGCMGGTGRTGTFLASLVAQHPSFDGVHAVAYIRQVYRRHAVETNAQMDQVIDVAGQAVLDIDALDEERQAHDRDHVDFAAMVDHFEPEVHARARGCFNPWNPVHWWHFLRG